MKQQLLFKSPAPRSTRIHSEAIIKGRRKTQRPLSFSKPMHLILKSNKVGHPFNTGFSPRDQKIKQIIHQAATRYGVKIYRYSINSNHFHFVILVSSRIAYTNFIRFLTARMGAYFACTELFDVMPFTRIASWGREFNNLLNYVAINIYESFEHGEGLLTFNIKDWEVIPTPA